MTTPDHPGEPSSPEPAATPPAGSSDSVDPTLAGRAYRRWTPKHWIALGAAVVVVAAGAVVAVKLIDGREADATTPTAATDTTAAYAPATAADPTTAAATGPDPDATVTIGLSLEPTNLNIRSTSGAALTQALIGNVYEGLVARSPAGEIVPGLAKEWDISADGKAYTFTLHDNLTFSNGHDLTAEDAAWSINQLIADELVDSDYLAKVDTVTATDPATVTITLKEPSPDLLWALSGRPGLVLDQEATNDLNSTAVGSGPFLLDNWKQGDSITLVRNDDYWGDKAQVKQVVLRYITDSNAQLNAFNSGDLDVLAPISNDLRSQVTVAGAEFFVAEATDKFVLAFNNGKAPLDRLEVRQAIRHALDHEAFVAARGDVDRLLGGPIAPGDPGYEDLTGLYPHDVAKAKELLATAGFADGLDLELTIPSFYGTVLADLVVSQLAEAGIRVTVKQVEFSAWLEDVYTAKDYELSIVDHAESHDFAAWANPDYYFAYDNPEVQTLYAQATVAATEQEAATLLAQAARIVSQDAAADWLINFRQSVALRPGITGFPEAQINSYLNLAALTATAA
jgi:peptide/nickel transport system substrate-binding protein